jgi:galactose mutarotase-like enzyme
VSELRLHDASSGATATIEPGRGGLVTGFAVGGRPILFLDPATLRDPTKNVRGGVPVLFPSPGKLAGDAWAYAGRHGAMKQHGFARSLAWQVAEVTAARATLTLAASEATRAQFPWDFAVEQTISVRGASLRLAQRITNRDAAPMPFGFGFHPYFFVRDADKRAAAVATGARRAFDNVAKREVAIDGIDLTLPEVDLHLLDHGTTACALTTPAGVVTLTGSPEYTHWVVWTLAGRDFVCVEPWTCPGDALNTGDRLIVLAPGESCALWLDIAA